MTLQDLNHHFDLRTRLSREQEILTSFYAKATPGAQVLTGMPHATGTADKVGDLAVEIADLSAHIETLRDQLARDEKVIAGFIDGIADAQTRIIFRLRFLRGLSWKTVADYIGGRNTEQGVKMICYRYLEKL